VGHLGRKTRIAVILLTLVLIIIFVQIFFEFNAAADAIGYEDIENITEKVKNILLKNEIYLMPDMAHLVKIRRLFYTAMPLTNEFQYIALTNSADIIKNIIKKSVYFNQDILSTYIMLDDVKAPYVLVNGDLRLILTMEDTDWISSCFSMDSEYFFEWRIIKIFLIGDRDVISVYRKISSVNWENKEKIEGYIVINFDRQSIENQIRGVLGYGKSITLFNEKSEEILSIGKNTMSRDRAVEIIAEWRKNKSADTVTKDQDSRYSRRQGNAIHIRQMYNSPLYYILTQDELPLGDFFDNLRYKLLLILIIIGIITFILYISNFIQSKKILKNEVELLYGRTQINSHFLLNAMYYIYWQNVRNYGPENKESRMVDKLCSILKYTLDSSGTLATMREEINYAKLYLEMQKIRKDLKLDVEWDIAPEALEVTSEKLITQTLLENSIQHGMYANHREQLKIKISAKIMDRDLLLCVEDSGKGMSAGEIAAMNGLFRKSIKRNSGHIGLININNRLKLQYGDGYGVTLDKSELGGLKVELKLKFSRFPLVKTDT
jgi:sensor histidine kinase YesM